METVAGGPRWYVKGKILDVQVDFLIDTGAHPNILRSDIYYSIPSNRRPVLHQSDMILHTASGDPMIVHGETSVGLMIDGRLFQIPVVIADTGNLNGTLGMQFLVDRRCVIDLHRGILKIGNQEVTMKSNAMKSIMFMIVKLFRDLLKVQSRKILKSVLIVPKKKMLMLSV